MDTAVESSTVIYSTLGGDPDLGELVEMFVDEIADRIAALEQAFASSDFETLQRTAHQLKGAGGSYGFDQLTHYAFALESSVKGGESRDSIEKHMSVLVGICQRLHAGEPG